MPGPRESQGAEAARAAALQAEFNEKRWVWVPDDKDGYLAGWVVKEDGEAGDVVMAAGGEIRRVPLYALSKMNPPKFDRVDDIADLTFLNEASVVHNLRLRYGSGAIYTYSGLFLVAINPYQSLPLYSDAIVHQYRSKRRDENPPHIFAIAERAWVNMGEERENQSILITGESGAGKTESTKKVIQYLAAIATDAHMPSSSSSSSIHTQQPSTSRHGHSQSVSSPPTAVMPATGLPRNPSFRTHKAHQSVILPQTTSSSGFNSRARLGLLERQILQANPLLEAFGNAQTQRNNNSSRFGKFVRISFAPDGSIAGANIDWYLLEKSRVVLRAEAERSFHVFYQLLAGASGSLRDALLLPPGTTPEDFQYLNKSRREVDGIDDRDEFAALQAAFDVVGFSSAEQLDFFRIVAAVLHIGNIAITSTRSDDALMPDPAQAERVCHLLGLPVAEFQRAVLRPRVLAGREWVAQARTGQQALDELAALAKTLYEKSFGALVDRINRALDRPSSKAQFIGVLDIAGFEIFDVNAYEQLLINYTNEKLQQFFNHHMFVLEQDEYAREGIEWDYVNFGLDLQPTIDLIEGSSTSASSGGAIGVLSLLDEECIMPKATDVTFTAKLHSLWAGDVPPGAEPHPGRDKYEPARFAQGFLVCHYAGKVEYNTDGWLEKNKDPLNDNLARVLAASTERHVRALFADYEPPASSAVGQAQATLGYHKKRTLKKGAFRTVGQRHKEQLASLMSQLYATQPHFVRCIVPNALKKPGRVDVPLVLDQLRCNGVLEGIRIARLGYPNRLPFVEFRTRYEVLLDPGVLPRGYMDGRKACARMVGALELDDATFRIGTSKIFFKAGVLAELEERRDALLFDIFSRIQARARAHSARRQMKKILHRAVAIRTIQRNARIYAELREWPWWKLYTKVRPLLAATRSDDELRAKEAELVLVRERAERDAREKEALEALRTRLEADRRRAEDALERERTLAVDRDGQLERSKVRERELEEEVTQLAADVETLDGQLDRALAMQRESEEKHERLRRAFDDAAEHLVRLETAQTAWEEREKELIHQLHEADKDVEGLEVERALLEGERAELHAHVQASEEDLARAKERAEAAIAELEGKLAAETRAHGATKTRADAIENDVRITREQLGELTRAATDYTALISAREADVTRLIGELDGARAVRAASEKDARELAGRIETLNAELAAARAADERGSARKEALQAELDELRALLAAKASEETARSEVERRKDEELVTLRAQVSAFRSEVDERAIATTEAQARLKAEVDERTRTLTTLQREHDRLAESAAATNAKLKATKAALADTERTRRAFESDLHVTRTKSIDIESQLAEMQKTKESLERQLSSAHAKVQDFEDTALQLERDKNAQDRQLEALRQQVEDEGAKRAQLEKLVTGQKQELIQLRDKNAKFDRDLNKTLTDLRNREWEVKQLESRQDKTIVEHVHVLEEAKRVTDRQLADARKELESQAAYIRSLEKAKARLAGEAEDLARATEQEHVQLRSREKALRALEDKAKRAAHDADDQRRGREAAEAHVRKVQAELQASQDNIADVTQQFLTMQHAKDSLETDLARIADETESTSSLAKVQRTFEARIAQLEGQLEQAEMARDTAARIRKHIDRQHAEIRQLVMADMPRDDAFRDKLLRELQRAEEQMDKELRTRGSSVSSAATRANVTPTKRTSVNGSVRTRVESLTPAPTPRKSEPQVNVLKQQVQVLELRIAASDRVRQHLEVSLRELTTELDSSDGSKESLALYRARLAKENSRLSELLEDEAEARRQAETAQLSGVQEIWKKFQSTIDAERESYARLEESRRALVLQQKNAQLQIEDHRRQTQELTQAKKQLQAEIADLKDQLEAEAQGKKDEINARRQALARLQDLEVTATSASSMHSELREAAEAFKAKAESYRVRLEETEIDKVKLARAESMLRRSLTDAEKAQAKIAAERDTAIGKLQSAEIKLQELESKLEQGSQESADMSIIRQRLAEEMEDERRQYQKDLEERDFTADQTRKKYQTELAGLADELQAKREDISKLREDLRKARADYDELSVRYDDEVYSGGAWKKERERLETKIADINKAYEVSMAAQSEQQSQIVALHSQVRELRSVLNDAEADRALLQKARRSLQAELETIKLDSADASRMSSDRELQALQLQKQDLERSLEEQGDRVQMAYERMKKAEGHAQESQMELSTVRVENTQLERTNAMLEKQVKELNVRIVDLETKSLTRSTQSSSSGDQATIRGLRNRVDELTRELNSNTSQRDRASISRGREATARLAESERQRFRVEEELQSYKDKVNTLRMTMDDMQTTEGELQIAKRRAEREAVEHRQRVLSLEHEIERLRVRLERSSSAAPSSVGSPRRPA